MNRFKELIKSVQAMPSVIVHLGAGTCSEYESFNTLNSKQLIFVEPDDYLAESAADTFRNKSHIKIVPCAIAAENSSQTLNITNNRRFSSLLLPGELLDYYPNIEVTGEAEVEAITLTKLCQDEGISQDSDNLLVAELQGMEKEVFPATEIDTLHKFKWIIIRTSAINLYVPVLNNPRRSLSDVMLDAGFIVLTFEEDTPPFINILCIRNDAAIDNNQLKIHKADLLDTIRILEHNLSKQLSKLDDLQTSHKVAITKLQNSLTSKSDELDKAQTLLQSHTTKIDGLQHQVKELSSSVKTRSDELTKAHQQIQSFATEKKGLLQQIKELSSSVETRSDELAKAHQQIQSFATEKKGLLQQVKELSSSVKTRSDELAKAQSQVLSLKKENANQLQTANKLAESVKAKENELIDMQQTLRINNKLALKSDTDLRDLQLQYRAALQHQEQQHTLLCELKEKLRQASEFYQKLNLQNLVLDAELLERSNSTTADSHSDDKD